MPVGQNKPIKALHNLNICHRHLCPEAILISGTGHCKISRLHRAVLMNPPCKMTEDVGVTGYKAPEVAACDKEGKSIVLTSGPQLGV